MEKHQMDEKTVLKDVPTRNEIVAAARTHGDLLRLGELTVEYLDRRSPIDLTQEWQDCLRRSVAALKDSLEASAPSNIAATELRLTIARPIYTGDYFDPGPSRAEIEGWALGHDMARSIGLFISAGVFTVLGILAFAVLIYGLDPPDRMATVVFGILGGAALSIAGASLGWGLFRAYVTPGHLSSGPSPYDAEVVRRQSPGRTIAWYVYAVGGICLAASVALAVVEGRSSEVMIMADSTPLRLATLASAAAGLLLLAGGAWPIGRRIIIQAEIRRKEGRTPYALSPRLIITAFPALATLALIVANWLFRP